MLNLNDEEMQAYESVVKEIRFHDINMVNSNKEALIKGPIKNALRVK